MSFSRVLSSKGHLLTSPNFFIKLNHRENFRVENRKRKGLGKPGLIDVEKYYTQENVLNFCQQIGKEWGHRGASPSICNVENCMMFSLVTLSCPILDISKHLNEQQIYKGFSLNHSSYLVIRGAINDWRCEVVYFFVRLMNKLLQMISLHLRTFDYKECKLSFFFEWVVRISLPNLGALYMPQPARDP